MTRQHGAFVYTGSGKKQSKDADPAQIACKKHACAIQYCLARSNHKQAKCEEFVNACKFFVLFLCVCTTCMYVCVILLTKIM